jgi:hypothetical protein
MVDSSGQIFTIDALLALLLITILIGISANTMGIVGDKILEYSSEQSIQRIAGDTADELIKTPGMPENWENYKYFTNIVPGLADIENGTNKFGNILSMRKISSLKKNPELIKRLLPENMDCNLIIYQINTSIPVIDLISKTPLKGDVSVVNRTVLYDYKLIDIYSNIKPDVIHVNGSEYICTHSYTNPYSHKPPDFNSRKSGWLCAAFNIDLEDIKSKDFYILTDPVMSDNTDFHASWILDTPNRIINNSQNFTSNPMLINSIISELSESKNREIFVLHVFIGGDIKHSFNTYIVGVPRGTSAQDVRLDNINPQPAFLIMKLWIK